MPDCESCGDHATQQGPLVKDGQVHVVYLCDSCYVEPGELKKDYHEDSEVYKELERLQEEGL